MPDFNKHLLSGLILGIVLFMIFKSPWVIIAAALYAILPDVDVASSWPFRFYVIAACAYAILMLLTGEKIVHFFSYEIPQRYFAIPPLFGLIILQFIPHRQWLHSLSAGLIFALPLWFYLGLQGFLSGLLGYYLHLLLDNELIDGILT